MRQTLQLSSLVPSGLTVDHVTREGDIVVVTATRIAGHPVQRLDELLPWNWRPAVTGPLTLAA